MSDACRYLSLKYNRSMARSTIYYAMENDPTLREVAKQCEGVTFDVCYRGIVERAESGNARDQRILFNRLAPNHGLSSVQKIELTGADGKPVQHEVIANGDTKSLIRRLSDEELDDLLLAVKIVNGTVNKKRSFE